MRQLLFSNNDIKKEKKKSGILNSFIDMNIDIFK